MVASLSSEMFRIVRRRMSWIMLAILAAFVIGGYLLGWVIARNQGDGLSIFSVARIPELGLAVVGQLGSILIVVLGASVAGSEYGWGTIRPLVTRVSSRVSLMIAKAIAILTYTLMIVVVGLIVSIVLAGLITVFDDTGRSFDNDALGLLVAATGRSVLMVGVYGFLAFMVATLARSNAVGITVALVIMFLEGVLFFALTSLVDGLDWLTELFISENVSALTAANGPSAGISSEVGVWQAASVLVIWSLIFTVVAIVFFRRRDVTTG